MSAVSIIAVSNTTPVSVTTSGAHGFGLGQTVLIEGTGTALDETFFHVTPTGPASFTLASSSAPGAMSSAGKAIGFGFGISPPIISASQISGVLQSQMSNAVVPDFGSSQKYVFWAAVLVTWMWPGRTASTVLAFAVPVAG